MKREKVLLFISFIYFILSPISLYAQDNFKQNKIRHKIGFMIGKGDQRMLSVAYDYKIKVYQLEFYYSILKKSRWELEILIQPQYNFSKYNYPENISDERIGNEIGLNASLLFRKKIINSIMNIYTGIGSGPLYTSGIPTHQASGFLFSNILYVGINIKLFKSLYLNIKSEFRHMSNAGFTTPNGGINNFINKGGILVEF